MRRGVVCNPVVELPEGRDRRLDESEEGCLSYPGAFVDCARPDVARVVGQGLDGQDVAFEGDGLLARCLQHETDHTVGRVFGDRLNNRARKAAQADGGSRAGLSGAVAGRLRPGDLVRRRTLSRRRRSPRRDGGKVDRHGGAHADLALDRQRAVLLGDEVTRTGESQAGATVRLGEPPARTRRRSSRGHRGGCRGRGRRSTGWSGPELIGRRSPRRACRTVSTSAALTTRLVITRCMATPFAAAGGERRPARSSPDPVSRARGQVTGTAPPRDLGRRSSVCQRHRRLCRRAAWRTG